MSRDPLLQLLESRLGLRCVCTLGIEGSLKGLNLRRCRGQLRAGFESFMIPRPLGIQFGKDLLKNRQQIMAKHKGYEEKYLILVITELVDTLLSTPNIGEKTLLLDSPLLRPSSKESLDIGESRNLELGVLSSLSQLLGFITCLFGASPLGFELGLKNLVFLLQGIVFFLEGTVLDMLDSGSVLLGRRPSSSSRSWSCSPCRSSYSTASVSLSDMRRLRSSAHLNEEDR
ncbi:hypothetical protein BS47DRAFT_626767 [Hydnum rufescens UP504]|uniref:Uncharacterized protein n=1 Tax=Hydnum rufescens UP504 TaxID=1448309 RepID=A0A9P6B360_9AGAM|nr:hypothetical protein BS47DRAFT_626767 [Hydnum rufescens UP504]